MQRHSQAFRCSGLIKRALGLAILTAGACIVQGADFTWSGAAGDYNWGTSNNWTNNAVPGSGDRAVFSTNGYVPSQPIVLGADRTISELRFANNPTNFTLTGGGSNKLTITSGNLSRDAAGSGVHAYVLDSILLGASGTWQFPGAAGSSLTVTGTVSDAGMGYGLTTEASASYAINIKGPATYSGPTMVRLSSGGGLNLTGNGGTLTNSDVQLGDLGILDAALTLDNTSGANGDRFGDTRTIRVVSNDEALVVMKGNASIPVTETVGTLALSNNVAIVRSTYSGANVALVFANVQRQTGAGAAMLVQYNGTGGTPGTNQQIRVPIEPMVNGLWRPWALMYTKAHYVKIDNNGCLLTLATGDYTELPASGASTAIVYRSSASTLAMTASQEVSGLRLDYNGDQTLDLGTNDLTIGGGTLLMGAAGTKTIASSGGRLVFRGNDIIVSTAFSALTNVIIHAPLAITGSGDKYLSLPDLNNTVSITIDGADQVGTYAGIYGAAAWGKQLILGGPGNRTVTGALAGYWNLVKMGSGAFTLNGRDARPANCNTDIKEGRVVLGSANAFVGSGGNTPTLRSGARFEIASGITNALQNWLMESGATIGGGGTWQKSVSLTLTNATHIAPGNGIGGIGAFTVLPGGLTLTLSPDTMLEWELGNGTNAPGADYDVFHVGTAVSLGSIALPATGSNMIVRVFDTSAGATKVDGAKFTIIDWTGATSPATSPIWVISNASPKTISTAGAFVTVSNAVKKIFLSGLVSIKKTPGTAVLFW